MNSVKCHSPIIEKLKSQRGASITFALLLFVVCAVVASIVITAGSAAGGRLKNIPESDQRYFAVTSAVEFLRKYIEDQTVTVESELKTEVITNHKENQADILITPSSTPTPSVAYRIRNESIEGPNDVIIADGEIDKFILTDAVKTLLIESDGYPKQSKLSLTAEGTIPSSVNSDGNMNLSFLGVDIYEYLYQDGTIVFYVSKSVGDNLSYTLRLIFAVEKSVNTQEHTDFGNPVMVNSDTVDYYIVDKKTTVTVTTYKWTLTEIGKDVVPTFPVLPTNEETGDVNG